MVNGGREMAADVVQTPLASAPIGSAAAPSFASAVVRTLAIFGAAGALLLVPLPNDYRARWFGAATDLIHVPLFALLTYGLVRYCWPGHAVLVVAIALAVALVAEVVQPLVGRSASWRDFAYGALGVAMAAVALPRAWPIVARLVLIGVLAIWPAIHVAPVLIDGYRAWRSFPVLADFQGPYCTRRWLLHGDARIEPRGDHAVVELAADPDHGSGMILLPIVRDWTRFERLIVDFSFEGEPLLFLISVRDGKRVPDDEPRFDLGKRYPPGEHHVAIELADLARGGNFQPIELDRIQSLHLIAFDGQPRRMKIGTIRLEGLKR